MVVVGEGECAVAALNDQSTFGEFMHCGRVQNWEHFFTFTVLLENLTVKIMSETKS